MRPGQRACPDHTLFMVRKADKTVGARSANNFTYLTPKKNGRCGFWPPYKKEEARESGNGHTPGVLHPHGCCIDAATKKVPVASGNGCFGRLQRA